VKHLVRIIGISRKQWRWMVAGGALTVAVIAVNCLLMALSGWFITSMAIAGIQGVAFNYYFSSGAIRFLAISRTIGRYVERLTTHEAAFRMLADLRVWLFRRLEPLAPAGLERYGSGDVAGRLRGDVDALEGLYLRIVAPLTGGAASILLGTLFVACWSSAVAAILFISLLAAGVLIPLVSRRLSVAPGRRSAVTAGELRTAVTEGVQGLEELLLLGALERHAQRIDRLSALLVRDQEQLARTSALSLAGSVACSGLGAGALLLAGGIEVHHGLLAGPSLVMLLLFTAAFFEAAALMPQAMQQVPAAIESSRRILELTDSPPPIPDPVQPAPPPVGTAIMFRDVSSAYIPGLPVLERFCLEVPPGGRTALTGPSGSGKSTVVEIVLRLRPYLGSVTVGGVEVRDMAAEDLHAMIAVLPQRPHLFNTTIRGNLLVADPDADDDTLLGVLADAGLETWISTLPQGLDTPVGEAGTALSGGEARRVALARTLLRAAPIMVLDEPTEGLDSVTEMAVIERLAERTRGITLLLISHRPACLALADRIVRMPVWSTPSGMMTPDSPGV
jgi:ATP-binding cassette subfamily C protein CydC